MFDFLEKGHTNYDNGFVVRGDSGLVVGISKREKQLSPKNEHIIVDLWHNHESNLGAISSQNLGRAWSCCALRMPPASADGDLERANDVNKHHAHSETCAIKLLGAWQGRRGEVTISFF